jgi:Outer membrane protein beta-barrel domain
MKTRVLLFSLILLGTTINGQTIYLKIGPSFSKLSWNNSIINEDPFNKGIIGFDAIAGINYLNFKYFNLSSNVGFIQKGGSESLTLTGALGDSLITVKETEKLNFVTINTTLNLKIPVKKILEPYIFVGPRLDYLISYKENIAFIKQFDDAGKLNKFSYGLLLGGGINFNVKKIRLGITLDYYLNMNKLVNDEAKTGVTNKLYDNTFAINALIGYKF